MDLPRLYPEFKLTSDYLKLSDDQKIFFEQFFIGGNCCLTGNAGVGKSFCINVLDKFLASKGLSLPRVALTGVAALSIGGSTLHSFLSIGLGEEDVNYLVRNIFKKRHVRERIKNLKVLFIDEISMCSESLLNKTDEILKIIRNDKRPFGGCKLVLVADFLQLPPINRTLEGNDFCFNSRAWKEANIKVVNMTIPMRQSDLKFVEALNRVRMGDISDLSLFQAREGAKVNNYFEPVKLFSLNSKVSEYNLTKLNQLTSASKKYYSVDEGKEIYLKALDKNCPAEKEITLKEGAQVMLLKNLSVESGRVNGSICVVMSTSGHNPKVKFADGTIKEIEPETWEIRTQMVDKDGNAKYKSVASRKMIPLKLAWSYSVHKSQSKTLEAAEIDFKGFFEYGQAYVALSRVKTLEGLTLKNFSAKVIKAHPMAIQFYEELDKNQTIN